MIRFIDAVTLAHTKLRTHRVRTGLSVGIAGILFGLILAVIMVAQGVLDSVERFSTEGLGSRMIMMVTHYSSESFELSAYLEDKAFIAEVEQNHRDFVAKKTALAKKYNIAYEAKLEDPSPIETDPTTKQKRVMESMLEDVHVRAVTEKWRAAAVKPFDIKAYLSPYKSATVLPDNHVVQPTTGQLVYMRDGKERTSQDEQEKNMMMGSEDPQLTLASGVMTKPFVTTSFDAKKGEIPVIIPFRQAEKLLGLKSLPKNSTNEQRLERLREVRKRVSEITVSYCYRNTASAQLLAAAVQQREEIDRNKGNAEYTAPSLQYAKPTEDNCGAVTVSKDTRTAAEKQQAEKQTAYEKELGTFGGDPVQQKIVVRGVGISGDTPDGTAGTASEMVMGMLRSWLGYYDAMFVIPADLLKQLPADQRPDTLFHLEGAGTDRQINPIGSMETHFVEFTDIEEARAVRMRANPQNISGTGDDGYVYVQQYGSSSLLVDEMKTMLQRVLLWSLAIVGGIALIILASIIGRTVSEGRRESAVFRAIGARRADIGGIYGMYAFLLSVRVVVFSVVLGAVLALTVELLYWQDATMGARLAYAAAETTKEFHLFGIGSWYMPLILGAIIAVSLLASVIPILLGARRNPIRDMRNE